MKQYVAIMFVALNASVCIINGAADGVDKLVRIEGFAGDLPVGVELIAQIWREREKIGDVIAVPQSCVIGDRLTGVGKTTLAQGIFDYAGMSYKSVKAGDFLRNVRAGDLVSVEALFSAYCDGLKEAGEDFQGLHIQDFESILSFNQLAYMVSTRAVLQECSKRNLFLIAELGLHQLLPPFIPAQAVDLFEHHIIVQYPQENDRQQILDYHIKKAASRAKIDVADDLDTPSIAKKTLGLVGRQLKRTVEHAVAYAVVNNKKLLSKSVMDKFVPTIVDEHGRIVQQEDDHNEHTHTMFG